MNKRYIFKYIISFIFLLFINLSWSQKDSLQIIKKDSLKPSLITSIRIGIDLSRPVTQLIQKQNLGFEITTDVRLKNNWYITAEVGFESEPTKEDYIHLHTKGSYTKLGFNYNAYENITGIYFEKGQEVSLSVSDTKGEALYFIVKDWSGGDCKRICCSRSCAGIYQYQFCVGL